MTPFGSRRPKLPLSAATHMFPSGPAAIALGNATPFPENSLNAPAVVTRPIWLS